MKTIVDQETTRQDYFNQAQYHLDCAKALQTEMAYNLRLAQEFAEKAGIEVEERAC